MGTLSVRDTCLVLALGGGALLPGVSSCKKNSQTRAPASLRGVTYIYTIDGSQVRSSVNADGSVSFHIDAGGRAEPVTPMDDGPDAVPFLATPKSTDTRLITWLITWHGVPIGEKRGDDTEICGDRFGYGDICEAIFVQRPADQPSK